MGAVGIGGVNNYAAGAGTMLFGLHQYYNGKKMEKNNKRPTYEIPDEVKQNLSQAQQMALQGLPEEQKQQFLSNIERGQAFGMSQIGSRKGGLAGVAAMNQNANDAYGNLMSMDAQARMQNQGVLMNQRQNMADYKDQAFQVNKMNPYYEVQARAEAMKGAGVQNIGNSFSIAGRKQGQSENTDAKTKQPEQDQMSQQYWNQKQGMTNYNPQSYNGSGNYNNDSASSMYSNVG